MTAPVANLVSGLSFSIQCLDAHRDAQAAIGGEGEACLKSWAYDRQWIVQALLSRSLPWAQTRR